MGIRRRKNKISNMVKAVKFYHFIFLNYIISFYIIVFYKFIKVYLLKIKFT